MWPWIVLTPFGILLGLVSLGMAHYCCIGLLDALGGVPCVLLQAYFLKIVMAFKAEVEGDHAEVLENLEKSEGVKKTCIEML